MSQTLKIITAPDPILTRATKKVKEFDQSLQLLVKNMVRTLHQSDGIGLAANQVGRNLRLAVVEFTPGEDSPDDWPPLPLTVLINPKIIKKGKKLVTMEEGCLSVPNTQRSIARPNEVEVINHDISGHRYRVRAKGLLARVCQHEIDHLDGILITDHASVPAEGGSKHII